MFLDVDVVEEGGAAEEVVAAEEGEEEEVDLEGVVVVVVFVVEEGIRGIGGTWEALGDIWDFLDGIVDGSVRSSWDWWATRMAGSCRALDGDDVLADRGK